MPWMTYGTVVEYLSACGWSEADATRLVCGRLPKGARLTPHKDLSS